MINLNEKSAKAMFDIREGFKVWKKGRALIIRSSRTITDGMHRYLLEDLVDMRPKSVLDIGCGDGRLLLRFAKNKRFWGAELYGIDRDEKALLLAKKRLKGFEVSLSKGKSIKIPFHRKFDLIVTTNSYHEWEDKEKCIYKILGKLNAKGSFVIYDTLPLNMQRFKHKYRGIKPEVTRIAPIAKIRFAID